MQDYARLCKICKIMLCPLGIVTQLSVYSNVSFLVQRAVLSNSMISSEAIEVLGSELTWSR